MGHFTSFIFHCLWQFLLLDAVQIKTGRTISCHFEHGLCGWTNESMGYIMWERDTGNSKDRSSDITQDHTFKDDNTTYGYYVYTSGWINQTSATLLSDVFTLSDPTNFTFWYHMNGNGNKSLSLSLIINGKETEIWKESSRFSEWRFASVSIDSNTIPNTKLQLKFTSTTSSMLGSDIALDDLRLLSEPELPLQGFTYEVSTIQPTVSMAQETIESRSHLLTGSCTFDSDLCGYTPLSGQPASWFQISSTTDNHRPPPSNDGHYAYFQSNMIGIKNGETRSLVSPKLNLDGCIDLEFYYILPYSHILTLTIKLQEAGKITLVKNITGMDMKTWQHTKINNICVTKNTQLAFETTKPSYFSYVGVDNIKVMVSKTTTNSPPKATSKQTSKAATKHTTKATPKQTTKVATKQTTKVTPKQTTKVAPKQTTKVAPKQTTMATTKQTTKATTKHNTKATQKQTTKVATQQTTKTTPKQTTKATPKQTTKVTTKPTTKETPKQTTKGTTKSTSEATLKQTTKATSKQTTKVTAKVTAKATPKQTTLTTPTQTTKAAPKQTTKALAKQTTKTTLKQTTKATTKQTTKATTKQPSTKPSTVPTEASSIECGFDRDLCGFNVTSNLDSLPWLIGNSSGPTEDSSSTKQGRYLYFSFNAPVPSDKDPIVHMTSGMVDGHTYKCLLLRYKTSSNRSDIFNIYINDNSKASNVPSWTMSNQVINKWDLIQITLPDSENIQLLFEGLVKMDTQGFLAIDDWHLAQAPCKERPHCLSNPCKNYGTCKESLRGYVCTCFEKYSGTNCVTAITTTNNPATKIESRIPVTSQSLSSSSTTSQTPLQTETQTQQQQLTLETAIPKSTENSPTSNLPFEETTATAEQIMSSTGASVNETATEAYGAALTKGETYAIIGGGSLGLVVILSCLIARCYRKSNFKGGDIYDDTYGKENDGLPVSADVKNPKDSELTVLNYTTHHHL